MTANGNGNGNDTENADAEMRDVKTESMQISRLFAVAVAWGLGVAAVDPA